MTKGARDAEKFSCQGTPVAGRRDRVRSTHYGPYGCRRRRRRGWLTKRIRLSGVTCQTSLKNRQCMYGVGWVEGRRWTSRPHTVFGSQNGGGGVVVLLVCDLRGDEDGGGYNDICCCYGPGSTAADRDLNFHTHGLVSRGEGRRRTCKTRFENVLIATCVTRAF